MDKVTVTIHWPEDWDILWTGERFGEVVDVAQTMLYRTPQTKKMWIEVESDFWMMKQGPYVGKNNSGEECWKLRTVQGGRLCFWTAEQAEGFLVFAQNLPGWERLVSEEVWSGTPGLSQMAKAIRKLKEKPKTE